MTTDTHRIEADELRQFVERLERLDQEKKDIAEASKEVFSEAKGSGYDGPTIRKVLALRKKDPSTVSEEEAVLEMYKQALGM